MTIQDQLSPQMQAYYNAIAPHFDGIYDFDPEDNPFLIQYVEGYRELLDMASRFGKGKVLDIAAGTAEFMVRYHENVSEITLLDASQEMLDVAGEKVKQLGIEAKTTLVHQSVEEFEPGEDRLDGVAVIFFASHFEKGDQDEFWDPMLDWVKPGGEFFFIDSIWNETAATRIEEKGYSMAGIQDRPNIFGQDYQIFKRYYSEEWTRKWLERNEFTIEEAYFGNLFLGVRARKNA